MPIYQYTALQLLAFVLVLIRIGTFLAIWPIFGSRNVPASAKVLLAIVITMVIFPLVGWNQITPQLESLQLVWLAGREVFIGMTLGFVTRCFFYILSVAGEMISLSMGLSSAQMYDPTFNMQGSSVETFETILASLIFLVLNGHHVFLEALDYSFKVVPLTPNGVNFLSAHYLSELVQMIMVAGVKLSAPVVISILFLNIAMGIAGRAVPQINVLVMSLPVTIFAGFMVLILAMPWFYDQIHTVLGTMMDATFGALKAF